MNISLLSVTSKVFERLVHKHLYPILRHVIIPEQHGFVKKRSTVSNLLLYTNFLFEHLDKGVQVDSVYTDFSKAFDKVDHMLLLSKLAYNGIRGNLLRWFESYIMNRTQRVVINGFTSKSIIVTSGVPQGSILGPFLFVLFINDINSCFKNSKFLLYADDLKVFRPIITLEDCTKLQQDLNRLVVYCNINKLQLSTSKCKTITFTKNYNKMSYSYSLSRYVLDRVSFIKDLGVLLDNQLHLDAHIDNITSKAFKMYGFIKRTCKDFNKQSSYICLYTSLVRPQLEYAVVIWNPFYKKYNHQIETVQRKFLNSVYYKFYHTSISYDNVLKKYSLISLNMRRLFLESMLLYKICHNGIDCTSLVNQICYLVPSSSQRIRNKHTHNLFVTSYARTNAGLRAPLRRMLHNFNTQFQSIDIFAHSSYMFKNRLVKELQSDLALI